MSEGFGRRDYYRLLQVDPAAHPEIVRAAYRTHLRVLGKHPDVGGQGTEASAIIEAYATVSNPERRRAYDMWLRAHAAPPRAVQGFPADVDQWMRSVLAEYHEAPTAPFAGRFDLVLDGQSANASAGDLIRLPRGIPHGLFNNSQANITCLFWVSPTRRLWDLFQAIDNLADPAEVVRLAGLHEVNFLPPPG